mmetsp:Transcript_10390/g.11476  ORF Transcript_10390/g.11476 Transcript_10390/m.11476 type:complete len:198 (-) Transcript_10390:60-653(-)
MNHPPPAFPSEQLTQEHKQGRTPGQAQACAQVNTHGHKPGQSLKGIRFQDGHGITGGTYYGTVNRHGKRDGQGIMHHDDRSLYEGSWENDKRNGSGTLHYSSGSELHTWWVDNTIHGSGTYYYPDGRIDLRKYRHNECDGEGVQYSPDRQCAYLLNCESKKKKIPLSQASKIAQKLGLSIPPPNYMYSIRFKQLAYE